MRTVSKDGDDFEVEDDVEKDFRTLDILQSPLIQRMRIVAKTNNAIAVILKDIDLMSNSIRRYLNDIKDGNDPISWDIGSIIEWTYDEQCYFHYPEMYSIKNLKVALERLCESIALLKRFENDN